MSPDRPYRGARWLVALLALATLAATTSACEAIPGLSSDAAEGAAVLATPQANHGPCLPTYGQDVRSVSMSRGGDKILYLSGAKPAGLPDDAPWRRNDRAVHLMTLTADGAASTRALILPWAPAAENFIPVWPTEDLSDSSPPEPTILEEQMQIVELSAPGDRFVLGLTRQGVSGGLAKVFTGVIPAADETLEPGNGLVLVRINDFVGTEPVRAFTLSPDGVKMAAVVGSQGELRVFDLAADQLYLYSRGEEGNVEISNELPPAKTTINQGRIPALAHPGVLRVSWSPDSTQLAISRYESVGVAGVWLLDHVTGQASLVRTFSNTTVPHVAWSADGQSLFVLTTSLLSGNSFGDSEVRRVEAQADGADLGDRWQLVQVTGYRTAPADFIAYGDDQNFMFTWEEQAWLLQVPVSGSGNATYGPVTLEPRFMRVDTGTLSLSPEADRAAFRVKDSAGTHVGLRLDVTQEVCDAAGGAPAPSGEEGAGAPDEAGAAADEGAESGEAAPTEGEGGEAPAEGQGEEATPSGEGG